jgi:hypothetical protein
MRIDVYTKTILTLIALLLGAVAFRPIVQPTPALAQANLSAFQITGGGGDLWAIEKNTGKVWIYSADLSGAHVRYLGRLVEVGKPLQ